MRSNLIVAELVAVDGDKLIGSLTLPPKEFKTGSKGYYGSGKIEYQGKRYQTQIQMVEIGSGSTLTVKTKKLTDKAKAKAKKPAGRRRTG